MSEITDIFMEFSDPGIERKTAVENSHGTWIVSSIRRTFPSGYVVDETAVYQVRENSSLFDSIYVVGKFDYHNVAVERLRCEWNPHQTEQEKS